MSTPSTWNRQQPSAMPSHRYRDVYQRVSVPLTDRHWPTNRITAAPLWVPVDLRDGNQALAEPMDPARKRRFFDMLVAMGYKEIEVGYPSASQTDFDFVRLIGEEGLAPEDVTIVVFTPARRDLIERTVESIRGITNHVVIHMYTATAPVWRDVVLGTSREALADMIVAGGRDILELAGDMPNVRFQFSPEVFMLTEPDFVLEVCDRMTALWDATPQRPVTLNLPATWRSRPPMCTPIRSNTCTGTWHGATASSCRCIRTMTAAPESPVPNWPYWRARSASRAACSAMVNAPGMWISRRWR